MFPLVLDRAADTIPVAVTCRVLGFVKQAFYQWRADPIRQRDRDDADLIKLCDRHPPRRPRVRLPIHRRRAGRPRADRWPQPGRPIVFPAADLLRPRETTRTLWPGPPVHDDLVAREFHADELNARWLTDITEHPPKRQALPQRGQGRLSQPDRRLLNGLPNDLATGSRRRLQRSRATTTPAEDRGALRSRQPVPFSRFPRRAARPRSARIDGAGRNLRGQRGSRTTAGRYG